jgi:hypothetical protein
MVGFQIPKVIGVDFAGNVAGKGEHFGRISRFFVGFSVVAAAATGDGWP